MHTSCGETPLRYLYSAIWLLSRTRVGGALLHFRRLRLPRPRASSTRASIPFKRCSNPAANPCAAASGSCGALASFTTRANIGYLPVLKIAWVCSARLRIHCSRFSPERRLASTSAISCRVAADKRKERVRDDQHLVDIQPKIIDHAKRQFQATKRIWPQRRPRRGNANRPRMPNDIALMW